VTALLENANHELETPGIQSLTRTGEADAGLAIRADTGQVITGGGFDFEAWAAMIREALRGHRAGNRAQRGTRWQGQGSLLLVRAGLAGPAPTSRAIANAILRVVLELDKGPEQ
jgi:hypothetical protein